MDQARGQGASGARNGNEEAGHGVRTKVGVSLMRASEYV